MSSLARHLELTRPRAAAFQALFGAPPRTVYPAHHLVNGPDDVYPIDVFVYELQVEGEGQVTAAVTNGLSNQRLPAATPPGLSPLRRELVQYFRDCTPEDARRLRNVAWLPLFDGLPLGESSIVAWKPEALDGWPYPNALLLPPLPQPHREFTATVEGDEVALLWHVPLTAAELAYEQTHGLAALLERMEAAGLPWVFDPATRPALVAPGA